MLHFERRLFPGFLFYLTLERSQVTETLVMLGFQRLKLLRELLGLLLVQLLQFFLRFRFSLEGFRQGRDLALPLFMLRLQLFVFTGELLRLLRVCLLQRLAFLGLATNKLFQ